MVCATVCLTVMPSFSARADVSTVSHSFKTDRSRTPSFHVAQYGDDIIGREYNLRKLPGRQWESNPQPSEQLRPMTIKTSASTETATAAYIKWYISFLTSVCTWLLDITSGWFVIVFIPCNSETNDISECTVFSKCCRVIIVDICW